MQAERMSDSMYMHVHTPATAYLHVRSARAHAHVSHTQPGRTLSFRLRSVVFQELTIPGTGWVTGFLNQGEGRCEFGGREETVVGVWCLPSIAG